MDKKILSFNILFLIFFAKVYANFHNDSLYFTIKSSSLSGSQIKIGYHYGNRTFQKGILEVDKSGKGEFVCPYQEGLFFLIFPDTTFYNFLVTEGETYSFSIDRNAGGYSVSLVSNGVSEAYSSYLKSSGKISEQVELLKAMSDKSAHSDQKPVIQAKLQQMKSMQDSLTRMYIRDFKGTLLGDMLNASQPPSIPRFEPPRNGQKSDSLKWMLGIHYFHDHYLDNINWSDKWLVYTPVLENRISTYLDKIVDQRPDSLVSAIDKILSKTSDSTFKNFLFGFLLEKYEHTRYQPVSEYMFAHVANKMLDENTTLPSVENDRLRKELNRIEPALLGNVAPEIVLPGKDQKMHSLGNVIADHTLLIFWEPGCSTCDKVIKELTPVLSKYSYLDLKVFTVSTGQDIQAWRDYINKRFPKQWVNVYQTAQNKPSLEYNISLTPSMFLLDSGKKIIQKYFTVAELEEALFRIATKK